MYFPFEMEAVGDVYLLCLMLCYSMHGVFGLGRDGLVLASYCLSWLMEVVP